MRLSLKEHTAKHFAVCESYQENKRNKRNQLLFGLFVLGLLLAPLTILIELDLLGNQFLVLAGPVIYPLAIATGELY
ncbi:hypothetical protein A3I95_02465 [Candidatus Nomurabacteria bacterium RIFCSPLOWO2_02_FULL_44_12]|uniref:Uncharacterized protein n=1 Tax=Candidatus Nomurabacteria bacterium RIFCSPLOWO2_12_FULL_44_11 TaxID=1801796 RepID=A0A1F6Y7X1_9BACT|nr:MAG: hypothetical protein A3E95_00655 [Candidatus Nomurabacteria bacterium RIFCSPHIGHO2_12_FULL_44_22b]OGJ02436.1 MAG: hypothetical protein A3G53_03445 [Candidatus Nomurabacteria bacterium RIFCSPLOWO2_12_FULL_44_11]OGJ07029.1 MAG: hypothetical protein A3I95_02465 [Candidatus Nomurabacteria bacterium RIFCSPLOWO2_02_FULL_44_12]